MQEFRVGTSVFARQIDDIANENGGSIGSHVLLLMPVCREAGNRSWSPFYVFYSYARRHLLAPAQFDPSTAKRWSLMYLSKDDIALLRAMPRITPVQHQTMSVTTIL